MDTRQIMTEKRESLLQQCDFAKTILMLLIVICHSLALWAKGGWFNQAPASTNGVFTVVTEWLGTFHVHCFTLISGFIYAYLRFETGKYQAFGFFLKGKAKRLLIPYALTSVLWAAPAYIYYYDTDLQTVVNKYVLGISPSQLWFLLMLFGVFMIAYFVGEKAYHNNFLINGDIT